MLRLTQPLRGTSANWESPQLMHSRGHPERLVEMVLEAFPELDETDFESRNWDRVRPMTTPRLNIDLDKIYHNAHTLVDLLADRGISVTGVTKATLGSREIAEVLVLRRCARRSVTPALRTSK